MNLETQRTTRQGYHIVSFHFLVFVVWLGAFMGMERERRLLRGFNDRDVIRALKSDLAVSLLKIVLGSYKSKFF